MKSINPINSCVSILALSLILLSLTGCSVSRLHEGNWIPQKVERNYDFYICYPTPQSDSFDKNASQLASCMISKGYTLRLMTLGELIGSTVTLPFIPPIMFIGFLGGANGISMDWYDEHNGHSVAIVPRLDTQYKPAARMSSQQVLHIRKIQGEICDVDADCDNSLTCVAQPQNGVKVCRSYDYIKHLTTKSEANVNQKNELNSKALYLENFKTQCKELGFKIGTTDFGKCVLELNSNK